MLLPAIPDVHPLEGRIVVQKQGTDHLHMRQLNLLLSVVPHKSCTAAGLTVERKVGDTAIVQS